MKQKNSKINPKKRSSVSSVSSTKLKYSEQVNLASPSNENAGFTIRLSDLGILQRTASEVDLRIHGDRIVTIIDKTAEKLQIALCLPYFLKHDSLMLRRFLQDPEVEFIQNVCLKYVRVGHIQQLKQSIPFQKISSIVDRISLFENAKLKVIEQGQLVDPHMAQAVEMLWKSRGLKEYALQNFNNIANVQSITLVQSLHQLKEIAAKKLSVNAQEQRTHEYNLKKAWNTNSKIQADIEEAKQQLENQRSELGTLVKEKQTLVEEYKNSIERLNLQFKEDVNKKVIDSERFMAEASQISEILQVELSTDAKTATQQYENLLIQHMAYEKSLRAKRFKVETQLSSWLAKFDADMGERQAELEELTRGYEAEKAQVDALQAKFDEQEEEYVVLMGEKEEEERKIFEIKAYQYLIHRSARKIQRYWRDYRQRKIEKKKAKQAKAKEKKQKQGTAADKAKEPNTKKGGKGKDKKGKGKKEPKEATPFRGADPMAALEKTFGGGVLGELQGEEFRKQEVVVDLSADT